MSKPLHADVERKNGVAVVTLRGDLLENAEAVLGPLAKQLRKDEVVSFDLQGLGSITSSAIPRWVEFLKSLKQEYSFESCTSYFIDYVNVLATIKGSGEIRSLLAPYVCKACKHAPEVLLETKDLDREEGLPDRCCPKCAGTLVPDVDRYDYLTFMDTAGV